MPVCRQQTWAAGGPRVFGRPATIPDNPADLDAGRQAGFFICNNKIGQESHFS